MYFCAINLGRHCVNTVCQHGANMGPTWCTGLNTSIVQCKMFPLTLDLMISTAQDYATTFIVLPPNVSVSIVVPICILWSKPVLIHSTFAVKKNHAKVAIPETIG